MTYSEAIDFLYSLRLFGAKFGLDNTFKLAAMVGNPQDRLRFIHVAGTNGKGSTCAMLESVYRASGLRVGLFTSPHLVSFSERIQVNRVPIPETEVVRWLSHLKTLMEDPCWQTAPDHASGHPTFFEAVTIMALCHFASEHCDLVIWETGLGGRLDATNIVTPLASVITNVQFDHQQWLGDTLAKIAAEKAGIIKPHVPVITASDVPEALDVIRAVAERQGAPLTVLRDEDEQEPVLRSVCLPLRGDHQQVNAALALTTIHTLQSVLPVTPEMVRKGLEQVSWPGRFQMAQLPGGQKVILDGAHNPAGAGTLRATFAQLFPQERPTLVLGILKDKDWMAMCDILAPLAGRILLVPVHSERTACPDDLRQICQRSNPNARIDPCENLTVAMAAAASDPLVVICGSLYLIGEAIELLGLNGDSPLGERGLNEWSAGRGKAGLNENSQRV